MEGIKKMMKHKKGMLNQLGALGVGVVSLVITMAVAFLIMANVGSNSAVAADPNATAAVTTLTNAAATIPTWVPLVIIAVIGALLLGLVRMFR